ncbi:MAG: helix-turn-helix domain-containing protein, partial [Spirochaetaceae bacterium]|nr:helix-turn-helix domain-containing protein [Spirochaetaceae bacterium]
LLTDLEYPGNVRELRSILFDAVGRCRDNRLSVENFPSLESFCLSGGGDLRWPAVLPNLKQTGELLVKEAMRRAGDNQTAAAKLLGITQPALNKRLKKTESED